MVRNCAPPRMEPTLYDEQVFNHRICNNRNQMKRNFTLELNASLSEPKKMKYNPAVSAAPVLSSPDLHMLKLASPELEKLIIQNGMVGGQTPTPTTQILFPRPVTEEQEMYALGFVEALNLLHNGDSNQGAPSVGGKQMEMPITSVGNCSGGGITYTNLDQNHGGSGGGGGISAFNIAGSGFPSSLVDATGDVMIKDEPQTVPSLGSTPPMSPIDMESQERIKLERKRQRNRVAASKCRRRKLERISRLEDKVKILKGENADLSSVVNKLKEHVCMLKEQVLEHLKSGCQFAAIETLTRSPHAGDYR